MVLVAGTFAAVWKLGRKLSRYKFDGAALLNLFQAVGQICSMASMVHNLNQCRTLVAKAASLGAKALFLPEASDYIASSPAESIALAKPITTSPFILGLQEAARAHKLPIHVGIHEPAEDQGGQGEKQKNRLKNTVVWIDEDGVVGHRYQKLHLFDVEIDGGPILKESESVQPGTEILPPFETPVGRVGATICFDLRFPEISLALKRQNAQIITYPSAFTVPTGRAHWSALLRARAIETQAYVVAAAQAGFHNEKRCSYGHSMIVSPWGEVLVEMSGVDATEGKQGYRPEPELATAEVDMEVLKRIRREMPLLRRTDVYPEV